MEGQLMRCPNCGSANRPNLRFCEQCGVALMVEGMASPQLCSHCDATNRHGLRFCEQCAMPLAASVPASARRQRRRVGFALLAVAIIVPVLFLAWRFILAGPDRVAEPAVRLPPMAQSEALSQVTEIVAEEYAQFATVSPDVQRIEWGPHRGYRLVYRRAEVTATGAGPVEFLRMLVMGVNPATGETFAAVSQ